MNIYKEVWQHSDSLGDLVGWLLDMDTVGFVFSLLWLIFNSVAAIMLVALVIRIIAKIMSWVFAPVFCLPFRKAEGSEMKKHREWLAERYCSGDVIWREELWRYCSWYNIFLLAWPRAHATRKVVAKTRETIKNMKADANEKKEAHWLKYKAQLPYVYSEKEMERRLKVKKTFERYEARLWKISCIALYEYSEVQIFQILYPSDAASLPRDIEKPVFRCEYDEISLTEKFVPWLLKLEQSYADVAMMVGYPVIHGMGLAEVRQCCEEKFFATYYRFDEEVPIPKEYEGEAVVDRVARELQDASWWKHLRWWLFRRFALGISRLDDELAELRNVEWNFKLFDLVSEEGRKNRLEKEKQQVLAVSKNN